jgi:hypothetical protein
VDARIQVTGGDRAEELAALWQSLLDEGELRGLVALVETPIGPNDLGGAVDLVTVALGSGGVGVALVRVLGLWLQTRYSDVRIKVTAGSRTVELEASNLEDALPLLREALAA